MFSTATSTYQNPAIFLRSTRQKSSCPVKNCVNGYRFGFNGQEKDDEVSGAGNSMTATFWEYDARLARRWNLDPKPNPWESHYSVMGGNPICYNDKLGDKIGKGREHHDKLKGEVTALRDQSKKDESTLKGKLDKAKPGSTKEANLTEQLNAAQARTAELDATLVELEEIDKDTKTTFNYINWDKNGGRTRAGSKENEIDINFGSEDFYGNLAHEAKHAHQFLKGQISFQPNGAGGILHDAVDEAEGYKRQFLVSPTGSTASLWYTTFQTYSITPARAKSFNSEHGSSNLPLVQVTSSMTIAEIISIYGSASQLPKTNQTYKEYQKSLGKEHNQYEIFR